jgi:hypothetical protein
MATLAQVILGSNRLFIEWSLFLAFTNNPGN